MRILGVLAPEEVHSCVKQMFDHCRIAYASGELDAVVKDIAECSDGWSQHVHTGTAALFRGLHQADCDLRAVDFDAVNRQAMVYREASYRKRQSTRMERSVALVAAVMAAVPSGGMQSSDVQDVIERSARTDAPSWRLPKGMDAEMFMDHLIHQGVLQPAGEGMLACPIPSLRTWLIDQADALMDQGKPCPDPMSPVPRGLPSSERQERYKRGRIAPEAVVERVPEERDRACRSNQEKDDRERDAGAER